MTDQTKQNPAFAVADWLYAYRILGTLLFIVAIAGAGFIATRGSTQETMFETMIRQYPGATPLRGSAEITGILTVALEDAGYRITSGYLNSPVLVESSRPDIGKKVEDIASSVADRLVAEVEASANRIRPLASVAEGAIPPYVQHEAFLDSTKSGLIRIFEVATKRIDTTVGLPRPLIVVPFFAAGLIFLVFAGGHSFWRAWARHRKPLVG